MEQQRHLAAILFTDIVGYTAMMQENEANAVSVVKKYHSILQTVVAYHSGKIINDYGDGSLCTFSSTIDAIRAAIEIQEQLKKDQIPLRIGLHVGEILFEEGKVFGDGVNVASRIQSLGQANTILFSGEINSKIRNQPEFNSVSLGKFEFKNVDEPIEVFALSNAGLMVPRKEEMSGKLKSIQKKSSGRLIPVAIFVLLLIGAIFIYTKNKNSSKFTGKEKSIAVLPFVNMSTDKENEYFSDGMTEEITTQLAKISALRVIARTSSMLYKDSKKSIREIAEELGVTSILEGSVQKSGNSLKITAQLIDANTQEHIWADTYDRDFKDVFAIQSEVAQTIAYQLNANLTKDEIKKIEKTPTNKPEAYQYYLQGYQIHNKFWETRKIDLYETSKTMFEKAISLDSNYTLAYAALADLYNTYTNLIKKDSLIMFLQLETIQKAWKIDSTNDYVVSVKGVIEQTTTGNKELGIKYIKKAAEINPNNSGNLWSLALMIGEFGLLDESLILFDRSVELDPLAANNFSFRGICNWVMGKNENAINDLETAFRLNPEFVLAMDQLAHVYAFVGRLDDAKKILDKSFGLKPSAADHSELDIAFVYAKLGNKKKALELMPNDWGVLLALGMTEEAIKAMPYYNETDNRVSTPYLIFKFQLSTKDFEPIRNDPRFLRIMEKSKQIYEENKKKYSVMNIINRFTSSTP